MDDLLIEIALKYAQVVIKDNLSKCTKAQQDLFARGYGEVDKINDWVKLNGAHELIKRTIKSNLAKKGELK